MKVVCTSCFREERWTGGEREVVMEGGSRRPAEHPVLMAWNSLKRGRVQGLSAVGTCTCGQPLLGAGPSIPWTLSLAGGDVVVNELLEGPAGTLSPEQVSELVERQYRARLMDDIEAVPTLMQFVLMSPLIVPVILWLLAMISVSLFLWSFAQPPGFR